MVSALICTQAELEGPLADTLLFRAGVERHVARRLEDALMMVVAARPHLVVVDRDLPRAAKLIAALREDAGTRRVSIVVVASGDFDPGEVELLEAGANAILRLPPTAEWNERLQRLLDIPVRKEARFTVSLRIDTLHAGTPQRDPGLAIDLSVNGLLLETSSPLRVGDPLSLQFRLPDREDVVRLQGRVVREAGSGRYGVAFTDVLPDVLPRIARFLESLDGV